MAILEPYHDVSGDPVMANAELTDRTSKLARSLRWQYLQRLPVELIIEIFRWWKVVSAQLADPHSYRRMLGIAQVSRQWRDTSLRMPELWTTIYPLGNPDLINEFLARSGQAPLTVQLSATQGELAHLEDHFGRIEDLSITITLDPPPPRKLAAPKLHTLSVIIDVPDDLLQSPSFHAIISVEMPGLAKLTVRSGYFSWTKRVDVSSNACPTPFIDLTVHLHDIEHVHDINALCSVLPLHDLAALNIKFDNRLPGSLLDAWAALAKHTRSVEELGCRGWVINALWTVLAPDDAVLEYSLKGTVASPSLKALLVHDNLIDNMYLL